ncbi:hypothetical protein F2Q68_00006691 [Brassica cretica]|uniref:Uncharacterized protein n=1 Tax=Brassica cretica TaxID=69181 RepID=A0A8S9JKM8_BRACR|nr:hypothetical protein F2Q68_00006691 [Brassica cretica]
MRRCRGLDAGGQSHRRRHEPRLAAVSRFPVLSAYIWKSRCRALNLNLDGITVLGFAVGIRHVLDPPVPRGYYGNSYMDVYIELTVRELDESSISDIVKLVKRTKKSAYDKKNVEEELRNIERLIKEDAKFEGLSDSLLFLTDMRNIGYFESVDFGWKEPVHVRPLTPESAKNLGMILRPSKVDPSMEGGVKVMMTLPRDAMVNFKQEMHICVNPPVPRGYYGNSYMDVYIELTVRELDESSISDIVKLVKRTKKSAYDKKNVEEELRNVERLIKEDAKFEGLSDSLLFLTDMRNIGYFESVDFGWKEPVHVRPLTPESAKNLGMILRPSKVDPSMEGGVKVMTTLPRDAMVNFKQEMHICVSDI